MANKPTSGPELLSSGHEELDAAWGGGFLRPGTRCADPWSDGLDDLVRRLRPERALMLFSRTCPRLFDAARSATGALVMDRARSEMACAG
jgi:hypothetical protein